MDMKLESEGLTAATRTTHACKCEVVVVVVIEAISVTTSTPVRTNHSLVHVDACLRLATIGLKRAMGESKICQTLCRNPFKFNPTVAQQTLGRAKWQRAVNQILGAKESLGAFLTPLARFWAKP